MVNGIGANVARTIGEVFLLPYGRRTGVHRRLCTGGYAPGWPTVAAPACVPSVLGVCRVWRTGVWRVGA